MCASISALKSVAFRLRRNNTAIFSLINAVALRSLPVPDPQQLVLLQWTAHKIPSVNLFARSRQRRVLFRIRCLSSFDRCGMSSPAYFPSSARGPGGLFKSAQRSHGIGEVKCHSPLDAEAGALPMPPGFLAPRFAQSSIPTPSAFSRYKKTL